MVKGRIIIVLYIVGIGLCRDSVVLLQGIDVENGKFMPNSIVYDEDGSIWYGGFNSIYHFTKDGILIKKYGSNNEIPLYNCYALDVMENLIIARSFYNGICYLLLFDVNGKILKRRAHHRFVTKLFFSPKDSSIIVGGLHYTDYYTFLNLYDENTPNPSRQSMKIFQEFFENNTAYTLSKYDMNLNLVDSCDFIERSGENANGYDHIWGKEVCNIDTKYNIYVIHRSKNYLIRKYSSDFYLLYEFYGENRHFIPIDDILTVDVAEKLNYMANSYSRFYGILSSDNKIVVGFYQNPGSNWADFLSSPIYYYDVYTENGKKVSTGTLPFMIYGQDNVEKLFTVTTIKSNWWDLRSNKYYLVKFTVEDLIAGKITAEWIDQQVEDFKNAGG